MSTYAFGTPMNKVSAAAASSLVLRSVPGRIDIIQVNSGATPGYVMLHDAAAAPANGAVTPVLVWQIAADSTISAGFDPPLEMSVGGVLTFSTTGPTTQTLSASAWFAGRVS